jgi:DGQHR domain-containing protein
MASDSIPVVRVKQWLAEWNKVPIDASRFQSAPPREFYLASINARDLKRLSGVYQRDAKPGAPRESDTYVQRTLDPDRTDEITKYVRYGYPLSGLGSRALPADERDSLRKPGWLPTAIVANIISAGDQRETRRLAHADAMTVNSGDSEDTLSLSLPSSWTDSTWEPTLGSIPPLEIIDGQHRLSAFDDASAGDFDVPVVLFEGLDFSWQAYLFWTINIKPKRINASLAYDLYPLLREQDWLDAGEGLNVYRETRSQELVEALWRNPKSIWFDRINMLGLTGVRSEKPVTQSAFIGSLSNTLVRPFKGQKGLGGLFGGGPDGSGLNWPRPQQAAFLIVAWKSLAEAVSSARWAWTEPLRGLIDVDQTDPWLEPDPGTDPALVGDKSLLASDQGVRAFHMVLNDVFYLSRVSLRLDHWNPADEMIEDSDAVQALIPELEESDIGAALRDLARSLASYDWRNSQAPGLEPLEKELKLALRGSGGYNVLRDRLLRHLASESVPWVAAKATEIMTARGISG